jgi:hypothetical protein
MSPESHDELRYSLWWLVTPTLGYSPPMAKKMRSAHLAAVQWSSVLDSCVSLKIFFVID